MAKSVAGDSSVAIMVIPSQDTEPASRSRDLVVTGGVHDHVIGRRGAAALFDQLDNVRLIEDGLAAHRDFFYCTHTCYSSFQVVKEPFQ